MRIRSVRIGSFGKYRDWAMDGIPGGLTLITGNNESGKTTLMEFMRSTMFPSAKRTYPTPSRTDAGSMEIETESGDRMTLIREYKKVREMSGGKLPEELFSMDPETYRSIFAMDLSDLADGSAISSDRIRNRFLTIPGGERVPSVLKDIRTSKTDIMNEDRITERNVVGSLQSAIRDLDHRMAGVREEHGRYDGLASELDSVKAELFTLSDMQDAIQRERSRREMIAAQIPNLDRLNGMIASRDALEYSRGLSEDVQDRYRAVRNRMSDLQNILEGYEEPLLMDAEALRGLKELHSDLRSFRRDADDAVETAERIKDIISADEETIESVGVRRELTIPERRERIFEASKKIGIPVLPLMVLAAGAAVAAAGHLLGNTLPMAAGAAVAAAGAYWTVRTGTGRRFEEWMASQGYPPVGRESVPSFIMKLEMAWSAYERTESNEKELDRLGYVIASMRARLEDALRSLGEDPEDTDVHGMLEMTDAVLRERISEEDRRADSKARADAAASELRGLSAELDDMVSPYGGEEGFRKACADRVSLLSLDSEISASVRNLETATGMSVDAIASAHSEPLDDRDLRPEISDLNRRVGELETLMGNTVGDGMLERMQAERNVRWSELVEKVREWGTLSLEESMVDVSCTDLYSRMQPSVIGTANRYLGMMTDGRYSIDPDPRMEEMVIRDSVQQKTSRQWSSGLGDQVYLSIKMAVAKEMGSERLPMILDDILVRFDRERRRGACAAILEFAKDQQVFLFSCDSSVEGAFPPGAEFNKVYL